jgi:hypothetical protein
VVNQDLTYFLKIGHTFVICLMLFVCFEWSGMVDD